MKLRSQDESFRKEIKHLFNFQIVSLQARPSVISAAQKQQQQQQNDWLKCCMAPMLILGPDTNAPHTITDGQLGALPHFFFFILAAPLVFHRDGDTWRQTTRSAHVKTVGESCL